MSNAFQIPEAEKLAKMLTKNTFADKVIFQNTGLKLQKGKLYGLSGKSGSGKSTLVNIILGFYRSSNLKLTINNSLSKLVGS